jgi:hypothetical protein
LINPDESEFKENKNSLPYIYKEGKIGLILDEATDKLYLSFFVPFRGFSAVRADYVGQT